MKIEIEKKDLLTLLSKTQNIVEKRNTMPILVNVLFEADQGNLKVFATDLEVSLTDQMECEVHEKGRVAVNAKNFFDIIKELPDGKILLEKQENNWLRIQQQSSEFNLVGISPDEYPVFPSYNTNDFIKMQSSVFSEMIEKTIYSVSTDETRYHLNGVYFEKIPQDAGTTYRMVATDGHRLSLVDRFSEVKDEKATQPVGVIIPRKGLQEIRKMLESIDGEFEMAIEGAQLIVKHNSTVLMIRLIEGKYPNYQQLIPQVLPQKLKVDRDVLFSSLKRVSLLSNQKSKGVTFEFSNGKMEISSNNPELGDAKEEIPVEYNGNEFKIGFNAKYIIDVLSSISDESVDISLNDQLSPGLLTPTSDKAYTCVVMPMRI